MSVNLIFETSDKLRTTNFLTEQTYNIEELNIYINAIFGSFIQVFLILQNERNLYEIISLEKAGTSGGNVLYKVPINQKLRINNETMSVQIMVLDYRKDLYAYSPKLTMNITTEHYEIARQVYIAQEAGQRIQNYYEQIVMLTEQNKELYKKMCNKEESLNEN